jgi:putative ABC transport system permease protein
MRIHHWLIHLIGWIVPRRLRDRWQREWQAELEHREAQMARWNRRDKRELARRSIGAFWDALLLQPRRLEDEMFQDLRYGVRMMLKHKGFMAVAVLTLALGVGANIAMFSVLNTYLFDSLPYPQSDRLVRLYRTSPQSQSWTLSAPVFLDFRKQNTVFESFAAFAYGSPNLVEAGQSAERLQSMTTSADFFPTLGVQAALGRVFTAEEDQPDADRVVVLSDRFWQRRFGAEPDLIGKTILLDGQPVQVIGVMPPGFDHPLLWNTVDLWRPIAFSKAEQENRGNNYLSFFGRLKSGVTIEQAQAAMVTLAANLTNAHRTNPGESVRLEPLNRSMSDGASRNVMWYAFGLAGFVLLIACANLANLQLVRMTARTREFAVRAALGAGRTRLLRQTLTESLLISLIGGGLSLFLAWWAVGFISDRLFRELPGARISLDFKVFGFALLVSILTGLIFGLIPAWFSSRPDVNAVLRESARGAIGGRTQRSLRHALMIGEIAFAMILLIGAGHFLRGVQRLIDRDPGWRVDGLITAQINPQGEKYRTSEQRRVFYQGLEEQLRRVPGVEHVALSFSQPIWAFRSSGRFAVEGRKAEPLEQRPLSFVESVSPGYFETLGVRLLAGRGFTAEDKADRPPVIIINETMARHFWPNESAVGKRIGSENNWVEVVGVVNDIGFPGDLHIPHTSFQSFIPISLTAPGGVILQLRAPVSPDSLAGSIRRAVADLDPSLPVHRIRTARSLVDQGLGNLSLLGKLLGAFALLGLTLAAIGVYGVSSYTVSQRNSEIGIRMALGAQATDVLRLILGKSVGLTLIGATVGVVGSYGVTKLLAGAIPLLPTRDPFTFVALVLILVATTTIACFLPARRATKVDPMIALRQE